MVTLNITDLDIANGVRGIIEGIVLDEQERYSPQETHIQFNFNIYLGIFLLNSITPKHHLLKAYLKMTFPLYLDCPKSGPGPPGPNTKSPGPGPDAADLDQES